jgi:hypothetical protein
MKFKLLTALVLCLAAGNVFAGEYDECKEGCTPGYWKQEQHFGNWTPPYTPDTRLRDIFVTSPVGLVPDVSLLEALNFRGGPGVSGATQILLRAAVASLLNAASPDVSFPISVGQVVDTTISRIETEYRPTIITRATYFDSINNLGCPLALAPLEATASPTVVRTALRETR